MKIPAAQYENTVRFYRDVIGLPVVEETPSSVVLDFGDKRLWLDRIDHFERTEIWLELKADDVHAARKQLLAEGAIGPEQIGSSPDDNTGFWVSAPNNIIHRISSEE